MFLPDFIVGLIFTLVGVCVYEFIKMKLWS